jgi:deoxyxylulose-5-phosphate synthase
VIGVLVGNQAQKWKKILEALPVDVRPWISLVGIGQVKPLPSELREWIETSPSPCYVVVEDGVKIGGFGSTLAAEFHSLGALFESLGVGDHFVPHGTVQEQEADEGFSISQIASALQRHVEYQKEVLVHLASSYRTS